MTTRGKDPIKKITLADGSTRYRFTVDMGAQPDGKRDQRRLTFRTLKEARAERARIIADRERGVLVRPSALSFADLVDQWLAGKVNLKASTRRTYADALRLATDRLGHRPAQSITKADLDGLVRDLLSSGRRVGTAQRQGLAPRTVNLLLTLLGSLYTDAMKAGLVARNVADLVERPRQSRREMQTWAPQQAGAFLAATAGDRLAAAWQLSLYGLRRGEVLGLRWSDVDLVAGTLTVRWTRGMVNGRPAEGEPKTERSARTLPLDADLVAALVALHLRQRDEADQAGDGYAAACDLCGGSHVVVDEVGRPYRPEWYGDRFALLAKRAGLPVIRLHDARHTTASIMHARGVPIADISAWLGHSRASFTMAVYTHSQAGALTLAGSTLREALSPKIKKNV